MEDGIRPIEAPDVVRKIADEIGGTINECAALPDGSRFAVMSMPLPKDHWLTRDQEGFNVPPMKFRMGERDTIDFCIGTRPIEGPFTRHDFAGLIREAGKYAVRCATMNGKDDDFDPDALIQNLLVGMLGYNTEDGLSSDDWANPPEFRKQKP